MMRFVVGPRTVPRFRTQPVEFIAPPLFLRPGEREPLAEGGCFGNPPLDDMAHGGKRERPEHIAGNQSVAEHRRPMSLPERLDVRVVEGFVEAFPKWRQRAE